MMAPGGLTAITCCCHISVAADATSQRVLAGTRAAKIPPRHRAPCLPPKAVAHVPVLLPPGTTEQPAIPPEQTRDCCPPLERQIAEICT